MTATLLLKDTIMTGFRPVRDLALSADTPLETLLEIANLPNRNMALKLLDRDGLPVEVYAVLAKREPAVRLNIANRTSTPRSVLEQLLHDEDPLVAEAALRSLG